MRTVIREELRRNVRRVVAPSLAIVISVAFVTLTFGATAAMKGFLYRAAAAKALLSDVVVSGGPTGESLSQHTLAAVAAVPGVQHVEAQHEAVVRVSWPDGADITRVTSVPVEPRLRWTTVTQGRYPATPSEAVVDSGTAKTLGLRPGARLAVEGDSPGKSRWVTVVGVVDLGAASLLSSWRTLLMTSAGVVQQAPDSQPFQFEVLAAAGADTAAARDAVARAVGSEGIVRTGEEYAAWAASQLTEQVDVLGGIVLGFAVIALVVATIVIANTFNGIYAQRVRSLALLRCVGATRRQVFRSVVAETTAVGAGAALAGVALGAGLTAAGVALFGSLVPAASGLGLGLSWWMLVVPFGLGVLVALVAGVAPARRATRVAPLAAIRPHDVASARRTSRLRLVAGTLALLAGTAVLAFSATSNLKTPGLVIGMGGGILTLVGVLWLGPVLVPAAARVVGLPFRGSVPGRIAVANAVRNPARAAATSVALLVGVSLVTTVSVGAASLMAVAETEIGRHDPVDLVISASEGTALSGSFVDRVTGTPGTQASAVLPGGTVTAANGDPLSVVAAPDAAFTAVWRGSAATPRRPGTALVPPDVATQLDLRDGGALRLRAAAGRPVALTAQVVPHLPVVVLLPEDLARVTVTPTARQVWLRATPEVDVARYESDVRSAVNGTTGVRVEGSIAERAQLARVVQIMLRVVIGLLAAALVIAVVGIANTLTLSVLERSRELAVQRALGMTRGQLRGSLLVEALALAAVGALLGVLLGIGYGWAGARTLLGGLVSDGVPVVVPWGSVAVTVLVACGAGALAGVLPARRAARMSPAAALATD